MPRKGGRGFSIKSKWTKTKWLLSDRKLRRFVPETKQFTRISLKQMTGKYKMVYFKPTGGTGGGGIARIIRSLGRTFHVKKDLRSAKLTSRRALYRKLKSIASGRSYLLQKGIKLSTCRGRPFDLRMTMQRSKKRKWVSTVMFVKLGKPGKVVTNYHQGGKLALVEPTLRRTGYNKSQVASYTKQLKKLGMETAHCFDKRSKKFNELGLDVALDHHGKLWILEVNTRPSFSALKSLSDKSLYRTIVRYGRNYGRTR
ncbi:YheC/YheD family protein [Paenibacillus sp. OV219]|uniref:YheC/YheD family protein n=1 Tax=Paenibacillus sp. OV219 TaxID=1884377 RepID=UPI0008D6F5A4|nr:YheC/YheD family protein [Paenibacillus sp. OV219]SEO05408.1 YheC/D like ATP-grasp [Paenibacillus sp. OV219]